MQGGIKRDDAGRISSKIRECRVYLQHDNVYSCLLTFREVLEKTRSVKMLPQDEKMLREDINTFQNDMAASKAFKKLYGPVTFKDDDIDTSYDFMKQLIQIKEEEIIEAMAKAQDQEEAVEETIHQRIDKIMVYVERGDYASAKSMAEKDEEAADALVEIYNTAGIELRTEQDFEKAVAAFRKALVLSPEDEGLYYNLSRVYIEMDDLKLANDAIQEALKIAPDFQEGMTLKAFIEKNVNPG